MSSEQEEERKEYVEREPDVSSELGPSGVLRERIVREPEIVTRSSIPASERKESIVRRKNTNFGAMVAILVGIVVLFFGMFLVFTQVLPFLTYPWSVLVVLFFGILFIGIGVSLLKTRTSGSLVD